MKVITTDAILRQYISNVFATVEGEDTFYQKMTPFLQQAEDWFETDIASIDLLQSQSLAQVTVNILPRIIAYEAFRRAIPSLDIVLTSNGFGITNSQNVVPASKERVERLISTMETNRDASIDVLLFFLDKQQAWLSSADSHKFHCTIFPRLTAAFEPEHKFVQWQHNSRELRAIEAELAQSHFSEEFYAVMRSIDMTTASEAMVNVINTIREIERFRLVGRVDPREQSYLRRAVNILRYNPEPAFDTWRNSDVAKLFEDHTYKNEKKSTAFWLS